MEELVHYLERTPKSQRSSKWKQVIQSLPPPLSAALRPSDWRKVYSIKAINAALAKVRMVGFNEKIVITFRNIIFDRTNIQLMDYFRISAGH